MSTSAGPDAEARIERDLDAALSRLRRLGGVVAVIELPVILGENSPFADEVDQVQATASRDVGLATRELLLARVNRLTAALERLRDGEYGVCVECAEPITAARLQAVPEVQTCLRCQAGLERRGRPSDGERRSVFPIDERDGATGQIQGHYRLALFPNEEDRVGPRSTGGLHHAA